MNKSAHLRLCRLTETRHEEKYQTCQGDTPDVRMCNCDWYGFLLAFLL